MMSQSSSHSQPNDQSYVKPSFGSIRAPAQECAQLAVAKLQPPNERGGCGQRLRAAAFETTLHIHVI
jgi:hypothetical protein